MSILPSPLKSPVRTSTHVTSEDHANHFWFRNDVPFDSPTRHSLVSKMRPTRSALPSPVASTTSTSTQWMSVDHVVHFCAWKDVPSETPTHHSPSSSARATT